MREDDLPDPYMWSVSTHLLPDNQRGQNGDLTTSTVFDVVDPDTLPSSARTPEQGPSPQSRKKEMDAFLDYRQGEDVSVTTYWNELLRRFLLMNHELLRRFLPLNQEDEQLFIDTFIKSILDIQIKE